MPKKCEGGAPLDVNVPSSMTPWLRVETDESPADSVAGELTVGEVADLVGISVRTLHHWDSVGLVRPRGRTSAGYRTYSAVEVERVHRVLVYQEIGFGLAKIAALLDDPEVDEVSQLHAQRRLLDERIGRLTRMAGALDQVLASRASGTTLTAQRQAEIFGRGWREDWADEAKDRWGDSAEWTQFEQNVGVLSESDRRALQASGEALYAEIATAKRSGVVPGSAEADRLAERHRDMIGQMFSCTHSMQVCLGRLYVSDARFRAFFSEREPGLAEWLSEVVEANARRHGIDPDRAVWE